MDAPAGVTDPNLINNSSTSSDQLLPSADVQIGKTGPAQATAGTNITYTITVTNAGPSDAASVSVADPTPTGLTFVSNAGDCTTAFPCSLGTIPPGVSRAITSTFAVPAGYTTPDPIVNPATVSSVTPDPAPGNNTATAMTAIAAPVMNLGITKTNGASTVVPGTVTTYTITVSNAGPSNAIGATVIDNLPAVLSGATWSCTGAGGATCNVASGSGNINTTANIPAGAATITFLVSATIAPDATGTLVNTASVTPPPNASDPSSANSTVSDSLTPQADVAITKTGPASIVPGNTLVYTIAVTNTGPSDADGVVVDDPTPSGLTFVSNAGDCTTPFPCSLGTMPPGSSQVITSTFAVPQGYTTPAPIVNVAHVSTTTTDPNPSNNSVTLPTSLITDADVDVTKSMPTTTVHVGDVIAVTIDLVNHGPNQARGIEITDNLPAGLDFVSATATQGSYDETTGLWTTGSLAVNDTAQLVINATVTSAGDITNLAVKTGQNEPDPNSSNDTAAATTSALPAADVALEKNVDRSDALVGETVTFTVRATNRGPSPATGVTIADTMPTGGLTFVSATPSQGSYDAATGTWTVGSLDLQSEATLSIVTTVDQPGALVNNAAVLTQDQFDPNPLNNSAAASVNAAPDADLRVTKAVSDSAPGVGALLTYTVAVTNFGPSDATSATIHDMLPSGLTFVSALPSQGTYDPTTGVWTIGAIPVTASRVLSITARVTAASSLTNTATRQSSTPVDPNPANDGDDVTSAPSLIADLAVTKTPGSPAVAAGTEASWTIVVTNNGPSDVVGASVTDVFPAGLTGATWTCAASVGSACGALSGAGSIATTVNLAARRYSDVHRCGPCRAVRHGTTGQHCLRRGPTGDDRSGSHQQRA